MLNIVQLEEIKILLFRISELVDRLEKRDPNFTISVKQWLCETEKVSANNRMAITGQIGSLRGTLISAERGMIPEGVTFRGSPSSRRIKDATASYVLHRAETIITNTIRNDYAQLEEGERLARKIVAVAKHKGLISQPPQTENKSQILLAIWNALKSDNELSGPTANLIGLVGSQNAFIIVDQMLAD